MLLALLQGKRNWQVIPLGLTFAFCLLEGFSIMFASLVVAWIIVWLVGRWLPGRRRVADGLATA